jgi:hypothetical protein
MDHKQSLRFYDELLLFQTLSVTNTNAQIDRGLVSVWETASISSKIVYNPLHMAV